MSEHCNGVFPTVQDLKEVEVDQRALVKMLARYPGSFDILRELIQNADDADAHGIEIHFQTGEVEQPPPTDNPDISKLKVRKWIIKNDGSGFKEADWERLGKIAAGNNNSMKVGAFGVGFYSVLSKSDRPLVRSNGKSLQFDRGGDGKLRKLFSDCPPDPLTSVELELPEPEALPVFADLSKFLISSVAFLTNITTISVYLDDWRVLHVEKHVESLGADIPIPQHLKLTTPSQALTVESVQHTVQRIEVDAKEWVFEPSSAPIPQVDDTEALIERPGRSEDRPLRVFRSIGAILGDNAIRHDLYTAVIRVNLDEHPEMKKGVESNLNGKSLPPSFNCKVVYFNSEQCLAGLDPSHSSQANRLSSLSYGAHGIFPEDNSGRLFIGQSTNQTTGIGLHISAHFLPTMERGAIDLANGQVKAWNEEVLWIGGLLARIIYEKEMHSAKSKADHTKHLGLCIMDRFAFGTTTPHSGVSQLLQNAFFSCCHEMKSPLPVVSDVGISCASKDPFRRNKRDLPFLKTYPVLHEEVRPCQHAEIIRRYEIPGVKFHDIVQEFERGASPDAMKSFFRWWNGVKRNSHASTRNALDEFCKKFASQAVLRLKDGVEIPLRNIKYFTFFPLPDDLSHPNCIYIDVSQGVPTIDAVMCFGWRPLSLLVWLEYVCSQARRCALNEDPGQVSDVGHRILRVLVQFALVDDLYQGEWNRVAELMRDLKCIPTNRGLELPANSYFDLADVCGSLPVAREGNFMDIPPTPAAVARGFETRFVESNVVRQVLRLIRVRQTIDWEYAIGRLEKDASEESNYRFLRYLAIMFGTGQMGRGQTEGLKAKRVFYSEDRSRVSSIELLLPSEDVRKLGLPVLALRRNGITSLQNDVDPSGMFPVELIIVEVLGIKKYPTLDKIVAQAASDKPDVRHSALRYLLSNLETHYKAYKSDNFAEVAFIPTKSGSLARPNEVFARPVWEKLGFNLISDDLGRDFSRLGVKEDPPVDTIIEYLKAPEHTLPDLETAITWFETLYSHGKLPVPKLREELSSIRFVPVESPGPSSSESSSLQYICPKDCFITSSETKAHHRDIFTFVDFEQNGNRFLESCCAKKSPDASDLAQKILGDPQGYLKIVGSTDNYLEDLRTIASQLDSMSGDHKELMKKAPMYPAEKNGMVTETLYPAEQVFINDWSGNDFAGYVFIAPKDDKLEKMYREMGSAFLGTHVRHVFAVDDIAEENPPFNREQIMLRIRYFTKQRDETDRTGVSFDNQDSTHKLRVQACKSLTLKKRFEPPQGVLADATSTGTFETKPEPVKAGLELNEDDESYTLWMVSDPDVDPQNEYNDIAVALCHVLLKTYGPDDMLLLASLLAMPDKNVEGYYHSVMKSELLNGLDTKGKLTDRLNKFEFHVPLPPFLAHLVGTSKIPTRKVVVGQRQTISAEEGKDAKRAVDMFCGSDQVVGEAVDPNATNQPHTINRKKNNPCKQAYSIRLREKKNLQDKETRIRFFLALEGVQCQQPPLTALEEFAKLISSLAHVFDREASTSCYMFWKDTDEELMAFNRDQKFIFLNLAHYYRFYYNKGLEKKKVITDWYLIMAHEIAHNLTMKHDEYHGSLSAGLAIRFLPALHKHFSDDVTWGDVQPQPSA